ncbi:hypothetical protein [Eubacterium oxidoreducens]|uniref:Uncharacterized protein n=1 Tax=Eubacterium oxidoreducens TaxID=1732 RepID=A0A1G6APT5_EUBOX|nr:hypothetical protein [Eubacterium oxidoreducens]SDB10372.1 hypothetical protein SAMN02910417_00820 [Eubacterium oxidoreducens]
MTIKKFLGKTEEEAKEKAKQELGPKAIIMSVRAVKSKGLAGIFKGVSFEVTAAIEDQDDAKDAKGFQLEQTRPEKINLAADEEIPLPTQPVHEMSASAQAKKLQTRWRRFNRFYEVISNKKIYLHRMWGTERKCLRLKDMRRNRKKQNETLTVVLRMSKTLWMNR